MQTTVTLTINAPAEAVFKLLTEPDQVRRWMPDIESTETVSTPEDSSIVGTRFRQRIRNRNSSSVGSVRFSTFEGVISEFEPPQLFAVRMGTPLFLLESRYELSRGPGDSTDLQCHTHGRVTHWLMKWLGGLMDTLLAKAMHFGLSQHLEVLKQVAESDAAATDSDSESRNG